MFVMKRNAMERGEMDRREMCPRCVMLVSSE